MESSQPDRLFESVKMVKPTIESYVPKDTGGFQTVNRQKVSYFNDADDDAEKLDLGQEEGRILGVQFRQEKRAPQPPVPLPGVVHRRFKVLPMDGLATPHLQTKTVAKLKAKPQNTDKMTQDILQEWNASPGQCGKEYNICFFEEAREEIQELTDALSKTSLRKVGSGSFGDVYAVKNKKEPAVYMKETKKAVNPNEIMVPFKLQPCPNLAQVYGIDVRRGFFRILVQNCGPCLKALVADPSFMSYMRNTDNLSDFAQQLYSGVAFLEKSRVCHGDVKLENICAACENGAWVPRLIDFGTCQTSKDKPSLGGNTPETLSPKVNQFILDMMDNKAHPDDQGTLLFDEKVDSWSAAIVVLSILNCGRHPMPEVQQYPPNAGWEHRRPVMEKIASMTDSEVDGWLPMSLPPIIRGLLEKNLCIEGRRRAGAILTVEFLRKARHNQHSLDLGVSQKRGKKRPLLEQHVHVAPMPHLVSHADEQEEAMECKEIFNLFYNTKPSREGGGAFKVQQCPTGPTPMMTGVQTLQCKPQTISGAGQADNARGSNKPEPRVSKLEYNPSPAAVQISREMAAQPTPGSRMRSKKVINDPFNSGTPWLPQQPLALNFRAKLPAMPIDHRLTKAAAVPSPQPVAVFHTTKATAFTDSGLSPPFKMAGTSPWQAGGDVLERKVQTTQTQAQAQAAMSPFEGFSTATATDTQPPAGGHNLGFRMAGAVVPEDEGQVEMHMPRFDKLGFTNSSIFN